MPPLTSGGAGKTGHEHERDSDVHPERQGLQHDVSDMAGQTLPTIREEASVPGAVA